jgi:hypothetical protein
MRFSGAVLLIVLTGLAACSPDGSKDAKVEKPAAITAAARAAAIGPEPVKTATAPGSLLFYGYACGDDCTSHWKGYSWASAHQISDPNDCRGTSETFIEGCKAFAGLEGPFGGRYIDPSFPHMTGID